MKKLLFVAFISLSSLTSHAFDLTKLEGEYGFRSGDEKCPSTIRGNAARDELGNVESYDVFSVEEKPVKTTFMIHVENVNQGEFDSGGAGRQSKTSISTSKNQLILKEIGSLYFDENNKRPIPFSKYNLKQTLTQISSGQVLHISQMYKNRSLDCVYNRVSE